MTTATALEEEIAFYSAQRDNLLASHEGQFVLIKGSRLVGVFPTWEEAYQRGDELFTFHEPMLIRQLLREEPVYTLPFSLRRAIDADL